MIDEEADRYETVSPWMEEGSIDKYLARNPGADRLRLVRPVIRTFYNLRLN